MFKIQNAFSSSYLEQASKDQIWQSITENYCIDEESWMHSMLASIDKKQNHKEISITASKLITDVRNDPKSLETIDSLLLQYSLDTKEGILLMCLAEALLRIPDSKTADDLIKDKLVTAEWEKYLNQNKSILVNASTWGIVLTGKIIELDSKNGSVSAMLGRLINKLGEPIIRKAVLQAMKIIGKHFVLGTSISEALNKSKETRTQGYSYSFDMLGESAVTRQDAERYFNEYLLAIETIGKEKQSQSFSNDKNNGLGVSIKLSALHPRYEVSQKDRLFEELVPVIIKLVKSAKDYDIPLTIDAEEQDRHELMLEIFTEVYNNNICRDWGKLGLVIQAYSKRALPSLCYLYALAKEKQDVIPIRLVKGAYWDSEIKHSQQEGLEGYPVYTRKESTDVSYLVCAMFMLSDTVTGKLFPQFASHNAYTVASIIHFAQQANNTNYEFQRLHGMGKPLYKQVIEYYKCNVRIYAPVGSHKDLLPYLVRRLLENGANSSFVHQLLDTGVLVERLVANPVTTLKKYQTLINDKISLPTNIYGKARKNSIGCNLNINFQKDRLENSIMNSKTSHWKSSAIINGISKFDNHKSVDVYCCYDKSQIIGKIAFSDKAELLTALDCASSAFNNWNHTDVSKRTYLLNKLATALEDNKAELIKLCHHEAGKNIQDSIDEIREAVDFCRYYAQQASIDFKTLDCPGPTGELNQLNLEGRGVFLCISPWNFPLAIFVGQIVAALVAGNTVLAKPAEQTSLIAAKTIAIMHEVGFPKDVINLIISPGALVGKVLIPNDSIAGVAFTGSTETAKLINRSLSNREGAIVPFIAETGGQNAMIVDSTALPEQVAQDVATSAFSSAGQRCSALRVLFLQEEIADRVIELLTGIMELLIVGNPCLHRTDIGPVIDTNSKAELMLHINKMKQEHKLIAESVLPEYANKANYVAPIAFEIDNINQLTREVFGPILHIIRYKYCDIDQVTNDINDTGFGLTLGIHSRNNTFVQKIYSSVKVGNVYVNRNQIGATVGVQPFGGQGLSGTGPKAGGPNYLKRFAIERTLTVNTTAIGGNSELLSL
jgi:RHH-type proline utilization regulon transcriptional repressor/proline dehydrogenase/delta 1-pyrroline-5-carboxylate dehydrogenase